MLVQHRWADCQSVSAKILDFREFDSCIILILRGGTLMPIGSFPEVVSHRVLVGISLVGRFGPIYRKHKKVLAHDKP